MYSCDLCGWMKGKGEAEENNKTKEEWSKSEFSIDRKSGAKVHTIDADHVLFLLHAAAAGSQSKSSWRWSWFDWGIVLVSQISFIKRDSNYAVVEDSLKRAKHSCCCSYDREEGRERISTRNGTNSSSSSRRTWEWAASVQKIKKCLK